MDRLLYIDAFSGIAGDMLLGALIDAGVPVEAVTRALGTLGVAHELRVTRTIRSGISATRVEVVDRDARGQPHDPGHSHDHPPAPEHAHAHDHAHPHSHDHDHAHGHDPHHAHDHPDDHGHDHAPGHGTHRSLDEIAALIRQSGLSAAGQQRAIQLFGRLGEAEAAIHDVPLDRIHLHEVGALDSIIDIVGVVFAMEWLGVNEVIASPLNVGSGTVEIAHGTFPVPAPATLRLLTGVPVYSRGPAVELVTPTGALLVSSYAHAYGAVPAMTVDRVGYGAGTRDFPGAPNVVRVIVGERTPAAAPGVLSGQDIAETGGVQRVLKIECEIDDMNPQLFGHAFDALFDAGALDVFLTPVQMKKGRPGTLLTVLAPEAARRSIVDRIFRETTTIGVRVEVIERETLPRRRIAVTTPDGAVHVKVAVRDGQIVNALPEFEDCVRIARATGRSVKAVEADALRAWFLQGGSLN
jgi:uncharacterized protein (TIGR00299 family) protein